ncbi:MAG: oligosaccharide flippase family protein [Ignavibacteria bacterium]|nr:oligosaccharide flippase family protein [Ignavibacteria bacterium]
MDKGFKKNILKSSVSTSVGTISSMVFQFFSVMIMTRYVSKEEFGIYVLIIVAINFFNLLGGLGLELTMVKSIASENSDERKYILYPVLLLRTITLVILSVILLLAGNLFLGYFDESLIKFIPFIAILLILANFRDLFYSLLQGLKRFFNYAAINIVSALLRLALVLSAALWYKLDIAILIYIELIIAGTSVLLQVFSIPFKELLNKPPNKDHYKKIINFSFPLYINNMITFFNGRINIVIIGIYLNSASIALFNVAGRIPIALKRLLKSFILVYFPNLSVLFSKNDKKNAIELISKSLGIYSVLMMYLVLFAFFFKEEIITLVFSARYAESSMTFAFLIFNIYLRGLADLMGYSFIPAGYPKIAAIVNSVGGVESISCSILFIPIWGFIGAAYALIIMNIISMIMYYIFLARYKIKPNLKEFLLPIILLLSIAGSYQLIGYYHISIRIFFIFGSIILSWISLKEFRELSKSALKLIQNYFFQKSSA